MIAQSAARDADTQRGGFQANDVSGDIAAVPLVDAGGLWLVRPVGGDR